MAKNTSAQCSTFEAYLKRMFENDDFTGNDGFTNEYEALRNRELVKASGYSSMNGKRPCNLPKNRYNDILPYDHSRVVLPEIPHIEGSDYVNASTIGDETGDVALIASQGPLTGTLMDFWRMVWSYRVEIIVMCTRIIENGKHKCAQYWPDRSGVTLNFGSIAVSHVQTERLTPDFLAHVLTISCGSESRTIRHFHYTTWPDHGVPETPTSLIHMMKIVRELQPSNRVPIVVHCSAGCGRTGTIAAIDQIWNKIRDQGEDARFSVFETVAQLRSQRIAMVQTRDQYAFIYRALYSIVRDTLLQIQKSKIKGPKVASNPFLLDYENAVLTHRNSPESLALPNSNPFANLFINDSDDELEGDDNTMAAEPGNAASFPTLSNLPAKTHFSVLQNARIIDVPAHRDQIKISDLAFPNRVRKPGGPRAHPSSWNTTPSSFELAMQMESSA